MKKIFIFLTLCSVVITLQAQNIMDYEEFRNRVLSDFQSDRTDKFTRFRNFRDSINAEYAEALRGNWNNFNQSAPTPRPIEENTVPPMPYVEPVEPRPIDSKPVVVEPIRVPVPLPIPQPQPVEPIQEQPSPIRNGKDIKFYGINESVRFPGSFYISLPNAKNNQVAEGWKKLSSSDIDNTIVDCLRIRDKYNLCDWAYLNFLQQFSKNVMREENAATLLTAYLFCQSGYQIRLGEDNGKLILLVGSRHHIYNWPYFTLDGQPFYPLSNPRGSIHISNTVYKGEKPLSLLIEKEQKLGATLSEPRIIKSRRYPELTAETGVPLELLKFYDTYPSSAIGDNLLTRWAMYAETPLATSTKEILYPILSNGIAGDNKEEAVNKLLNWVQTGFEYEYDDKVWGHDRAFFAEETIFYPYSDCEDRSILFSKLVRDLLGLDVALIYYPGHLATAVKFDSFVNGDAVMIDGQRFVICDPTYIGANIGQEMPSVRGTSSKALILKK